MRRNPIAVGRAMPLLLQFVNFPKQLHTSYALVLLWLTINACSMRLRVCAASSFDIREHLSTKAPYVHRVPIKGAPSLYDVPDPPGYKPVFMYLLARHGSRWPTDKRMQQINSLTHLFQAAASPAHPWMHNWTSPMEDVPFLAGELHPAGEAEMMGLARRLRHRFPNLTSETYAPRVYPIISTQVPRAAQSASAFALGFFSNIQQQQQQPANPSTPGTSDSSSSSGGSSPSDVLGWLPQPVAVNMLPKRHDPVLRFFEACRGYREHEDRALRWLAPWMHSHWRKMIPGLEDRMGLTHGTLNACHVDALWQLCTFEAGLLSHNSTTHLLHHHHHRQQQQQGQNGAAGSTSSRARSGSSRSKSRTRKSQQPGSSSSSSSTNPGSSSSNACALFTPEDVRILEWLEDVRLYETQGYGASVNYEIAAPLLSDISSALTSAAAANAAGQRPLQRARLMFAHCETLTPLATLLGLFRPGTAERKDIPDLPGERQLKEAVEVSSEQVEADMQAADDVSEDLPLVVLEAAGDAGAVQGSEVAAGAAGGEEGTAMNNAAGQQQQQQQQQVSQFKRRRLSETSSSSGATGNGGGSNPGGPTAAGAATPAVAEQAGKQQQPVQQQQLKRKWQQQQQLSGKHQHGPDVEGCSYKGGPALDSSLLLPPPLGWLPGFMEDDRDRVWRGGRVAPLGANLLLVMYGKVDQPGRGASGDYAGFGGEGSWGRVGGAGGEVDLGDHRVRLVYNEQVVQLPGCSEGLDCSLQQFLEVVVGDKTSAERYRQHCAAARGDGYGTAGDDSDGVGLVTALGGTSSSSSSGWSMDSTGVDDQLDGTDASSGAGGDVLELETADGLPLLLPDAGRPVCGLWY